MTLTGPQPPEERIVNGRYRLVAPLGSGGFGRVWRAHDEALDVDVAVKEVWLPQQTASQDEHRERLVRAAREARNAARLRDHPHVVAVHDVVIEDGTPWIVMRLVEGRSLAEHLQADGPLPGPRATEVARALLQALKAAHAAGIVHRDLKPANVLLTADGQVLLTDFGIAVHETDTKLTSTGSIIGSAEYMAPERLNGARDTAAGDLFSLGATLYEAVEGVSPFRRATPTATLAAVALGDPAPLRRADPVLARLVTSLLAKDPQERPSGEAALALLHSGAPTVTAPRSRPPGSTPEAMTPQAEPGARYTGRRVGGTVCAVAGLAVMVGCSFGISGWQEWDMVPALFTTALCAAISAAFAAAAGTLLRWRTTDKPPYGTGVKILVPAFLLLVPLIILFSAYLGGADNGPW